MTWLVFKSCGRILYYVGKQFIIGAAQVGAAFGGIPLDPNWHKAPKPEQRAEPPRAEPPPASPPRVNLPPAHPERVPGVPPSPVERALWSQLD
ncbi:DUF6059 family protein [Actinomycetes bacterium KLBMP 9797]